MKVFYFVVGIVLATTAFLGVLYHNEPGTTHLATISGPIDKDSVKETIEVLKAAGPKDVVIININSNGGDFNGFYVIEAIYSTKAKSVITVAKRKAASMAALIWASGDELRSTTNAYIMFHRAKCGVKKDGETEWAPCSQSNNLEFREADRYSVRYTEVCCLIHLTKQEKDAFYNHEDVYINGLEYIRRTSK